MFIVGVGISDIQIAAVYLITFGFLLYVVTRIGFSNEPDSTNNVESSIEESEDELDDLFDNVGKDSEEE